MLRIKTKLGSTSRYEKAAGSNKRSFSSFCFIGVHTQIGLSLYIYIYRCESVGILLYSFKAIDYNMEKQNEGVEVVEDGSDSLLRKKDAALFAWPWKNLGNYKAWIYF